MNARCRASERPGRRLRTSLRWSRRSPGLPRTTTTSRSVRVAETHISWVFLTGEYAYKVKKPIKLPFLDFSSLERRQHFCEEELRLNRRLAPQLYLAVVPIGGQTQAPRVGVEPAIEYAVKMREFPDDARLDRRLAAGAFAAEPLRAFGARLARFHAAQPPLSPRDRRGQPRSPAALENFDELRRAPARARARASSRPLREWTEERAASIAPIIERRAAAGRYRECHGDLHLENLLMHGGEILAFDALEFDARLREIDVMSEASFLAMDLAAHGRADLAYDFLTAYLEASGDYDGLDVLRFYAVYLALVRAKVRALKRRAEVRARPAAPTLAPYLETARDLVAPRTPLLVDHAWALGQRQDTRDAATLIGGLRAVRVRSDLERKRLHGLGASARSGSDGRRRPLRLARRPPRRTRGSPTSLPPRVRNGFDAIVDADLPAPRRARRAFARLAAQHGARFAILDCVAPVDVLRRRIAARAAAEHDASEASLDGSRPPARRARSARRRRAARDPPVPTDAPLDLPKLVSALVRRLD